MKAEIRTDRYFAAYGKMPKGFGHWAFETEKRDKMYFYFGTYSEAKRLAAARAKAEGIDIMYVGS